MPIFDNGLEGGVAGTSITVASSAAGGNAFAAVESTFMYSDTVVCHGGLSARAASGSSATAQARWALGGVDAVAFRFYRHITAAHTSDTHIARLSHTADVTAMTLLANSESKLRINDKSGTKWTATAALPLNQFVRLEGYAVQGATASSGTLQFAYFLGDSTTAIQSVSLTGMNFGGDLGDFSNFRFGKLGGDVPAGHIHYDSVRVMTGVDAVGLPGPFSAPLPPPTLSLVSSSDPTTIGGHTGKVKVSWPTVAGISYDAYTAPGHDVAQDDYTLFQTGVTSPFEFTGLAAGIGTVGIQARP